MGCSTLALSSVVSTLGGLVFGYELGIISGALLQLQAEFRLTCVQQEAVVSALLIGALLASLVGGWLIDRYGRRNSILLSNVLILAGSLVLVSNSYLALVVGRITVGFAMCISSMACCIFVSEMVTPKHRGFLVTLYEVGITVGILGAYAINYILSDARQGWKYMFALAIVPTLAQFVSIWFLPSSAGAPAAGAQSQRGLIHSIENHKVENSAHVSNRLDKPQYSFLNLFQQKDNMRTRTIIALGLVIFQQFTGQPNVLFYSSTIFHSVGFESNASALLASLGLGVVKVIATLVSMVFADRVGRRPLLIGGCMVMSVCLITIGLLSGRSVVNTKTPCSAGDYVKNSTPLTQLTLDNQSSFDISVSQRHGRHDWTEVRDIVYDDVISLGTLMPVPSPAVHNGVVNWIILLCMMAVVSAYSVGFGPMTWLILSEIFPAAVRGRAFAFTNCFNWAANLIVTFSFLNVINVIGLSGTFLSYGLIGVGAVVFFYFMLPETKGKSLEQIDRELCLKRVHNSEECCNILSRRIDSPGLQEKQQFSISIKSTYTGVIIISLGA
ncbi:solute carrier family 2, facilitated glucose transporter member 10 isoform X1 [Coregonus clupeaformis]|uniref:solute carrier family 2, facilitated glucose transporter member 10 isoform X1 n=1 Tax=Coregonus clupeaformis TaxID=59861 RepID=UPI001BE02EC3|nr:solute carrier family 2, facilitated glucose transporter member 10 isoform X1 [Coregonus clupeaformis]